MRNTAFIADKIFTREELKKRVTQWRVKGDTIAFTNGCFDLLHLGHLDSLSAAAREGDKLIVAVNADSSVKKLKGQERPINNEDSRSVVLASLEIVDAVVIFDEETPLELIKLLLPDVLVKGGDYTVEQVVGAKEVMANGGRVVINPILEGFSTTSIIEKMKREKT